MANDRMAKEPVHHVESECHGPRGAPIYVRIAGAREVANNGGGGGVNDAHAGGGDAEGEGDSAHTEGEGDGACSTTCDLYMLV